MTSQFVLGQGADERGQLSGGLMELIHDCLEPLVDTSSLLSGKGKEWYRSVREMNDFLMVEQGVVVVSDDDRRELLRLLGRALEQTATLVPKESVGMRNACELWRTAKIRAGVV